MIQCTVCLKSFRSNGAFDLHRTGSYGKPIYKGSSRHAIGQTASTRQWRTTEEMEAIGMQADDKGRWRGPGAENPIRYGFHEEEEQSA